MRASHSQCGSSRRALVRAGMGLIDLVATDHSPCPPAMKHREDGRFDHAWGGIASLGLALPIMNSACISAPPRLPPCAHRRVDVRRACQTGRPLRPQGIACRRRGCGYRRLRPRHSMDGERSTICTFATSSLPIWARNCAGASWRHGSAVSAYSLKMDLPISRAAESWCAHESTAQSVLLPNVE